MEDAPHLIFEVTPHCNNNCLYCYNVWKEHSDYPIGELDTDAYKKIMEKAITETGSTSVVFGGGEPLLRKDLETLAAWTSSFKCKAMVVTNGVLLSEKRAKSLADSGVKHFELPLLSGSAEIHNSLCRNNSFDCATKAIVNAKMTGASVGVVFVLTKKNILELEKTMSLALALGADYFVLDRFVPGGTGRKFQNDLLPHSRQTLYAAEKASAMADELHLSTISPIPLPNCCYDTNKFLRLKNGYCGGGTIKYVIDPLGNWRICEQSPVRLGNVLDTAFKSISESQFVKDFCAPPNSRCAACDKFSSCSGGCRFLPETPTA